MRDWLTFRRVRELHVTPRGRDMQCMYQSPGIRHMNVHISL